MLKNFSSKIMTIQEIEQMATEYSKNFCAVPDATTPLYDVLDIEEAFCAGGERVRNKLIDEACEWLCAHLEAPKGMPQAKSYNEAITELCNEFRNAMKGITL